MPPQAVHFNGSVNLADAETVMREIAARVPVGVSRVPDGETGDRGNWIFFQLGKFLSTPGLRAANTGDGAANADSYDEVPKVRLDEGADAATVRWPDLGYAEAYLASYEVFRRLRAEGTLPADARYQVQYPTPMASINAWVVAEDQEALEPSYAEALFADLDRLLAAVPHEDLAVQWDVAVEFAVLEQQGWVSPGAEGAAGGFTAIVRRLATCLERVPTEVPVGMHLCYGDMNHEHFVQPRSLALQVEVVNAVTATAARPPSWCSFTVPQDQDDPAYFAPLAELRADERTELFFALVPYHPERQAAGTTRTQARLVDEYLGGRRWGVCTECGMGRAPAEEIPRLLDLHRELLTAR